MNHIRQIYEISPSLMAVNTASGIWTAPTGNWASSGMSPVLLLLGNKYYLRWTFRSAIWCHTYLPAVASQVKVAQISHPHRWLLIKYAWMFVDPFSWKNATDRWLIYPYRKFVDMPV